MELYLAFASTLYDRDPLVSAGDSHGIDSGGRSAPTFGSRGRPALGQQLVCNTRRLLLYISLLDLNVWLRISPFQVLVGSLSHFLLPLLEHLSILQGRGCRIGGSPPCGGEGALSLRSSAQSGTVLRYAVAIDWDSPPLYLLFKMFEVVLGSGVR